VTFHQRCTVADRSNCGTRSPQISACSRDGIRKFCSVSASAYGSPESDPDQHQNAILAAGEIQVAVAKLNEARKCRGEPCPEFGIGIHCGEVVHGFVGTSDRMEFTVIGDVVNRTARYCAAAAGGEVLISPEVYERVWRIADTERVTIKTKHEGDFVAYRVKGVKESVQDKKKVERVNTPKEE